MIPLGIVASSRANTATWTPANLPGLAGWWDADDAATFTYSSGTVVSQWRDKSGNARHLAQADPALQPTRNGTINARPSVVFDGLADRMVSSAYAKTKPTTLLAVGRNTAAAGQRNLIVSPTDGRLFRTSTGTIDAYQGAFISTAVPWGTTAAHSVAAVLNDAASKIAADSAASWTLGDAGTAAFDSAQGWTVGAYYNGTEFWQGDVCEIVHLNAMISDADRAQWFAYAAKKWGTP